MSNPFFCCRARAGPLVKECRALRPRVWKDDASDIARDKRELARKIRTAVNRSGVDQIELRLAAIGWDATQYVLTFDDAHLPETYSGVQLALRTFVKAMRRWRRRLGKIPDIDWLAVIEGLHGDHRWHIHFICDYYDLAPEEVACLWHGGLLPGAELGKCGAPVLMDKRGFRRLAEYLHKEAKPLGKRAYSCSRSLDSKITPPRRWRANCGDIVPPRRAVCVSYVQGKHPEAWSNPWGSYSKLSWLVPDGSPACFRALARMGYKH